MKNMKVKLLFFNSIFLAKLLEPRVEICRRLLKLDRIMAIENLKKHLILALLFLISLFG
jgi:hypothetical protein